MTTNKTVFGLISFFSFLLSLQAWFFWSILTKLNTAVIHGYHYLPQIGIIKNADEASEVMAGFNTMLISHFNWEWQWLIGKYNNVPGAISLLFAAIGLISLIIYIKKRHI